MLNGSKGIGQRHRGRRRGRPASGEAAGGSYACPARRHCPLSPFMRLGKVDGCRHQHTRTNRRGHPHPPMPHRGYVARPACSLLSPPRFSANSLSPPSPSLAPFPFARSPHTHPSPCAFRLTPFFVSFLSLVSVMTIVEHSRTHGHADGPLCIIRGLCPLGRQACSTLLPERNGTRT